MALTVFLQCTRCTVHHQHISTVVHMTSAMCSVQAQPQQSGKLCGDGLLLLSDENFSDVSLVSSLATKIHAPLHMQILGSFHATKYSTARGIGSYNKPVFHVTCMSVRTMLRNVRVPSS